MTSRALLAVALAAAPALTAGEAALPPDEAYVRVSADGEHLVADGQRVRLWGAIGNFPGGKVQVGDDAYFGQRERVRRIKKVGFNAFRIWHLSFDDAATKGDLSGTDLSDFFVAECGRQGVRLWAAGFGGGRVFEREFERAADIVDDAASRGPWLEAVRAMAKEHWWSKKEKAISLLEMPVAWDPRMEALAIAQMRQKAMHVNLHTGLRHADDPTFAVWELTNEQWWMRKMMGGQWQGLPPYFRAKLIERWNAWLQAKYGGMDALRAAWGFTFPGEDLAGGSVLLAPMARAMTAVQLNDTNPQALEAFKTIASPITREQCAAQRSADVLEFLMSLIVSHKQRWAAEMKTWGKSTRLSPLIYDTGIGESVQAQWLHQQADAVSHAAYMEGDQVAKLDPQSRRWPWYSGLDAPPQLCNDVPWLEHNRAVGKPFLCYETQFGSPSKYRAEWAPRLTALAAIQDWSAACWHYWSFHHYKVGEERAYSRGGPLAKPGPGAFQYDYTTDEVQQASLRAAAAVFTGGLLDKAERPTVFTFGKPALYDARSMDYAGAYGRTGLMDMMTTAYTRGMRLRIDPQQAEFLKTEGEVSRFNGFERSSLLKPTPQIEFDVQRSHLRFDAPGVASYTGFLQQYGADTVAFANGVSLSQVRHADPPGTPVPTGDERFVSFTLASEDGKPLAQTSRAVLVLVSSSGNTGLQVDRAQRKITNYGDLPILVTRVAGTVAAPAVAGMRWRMIDFDEQVLAEGTVGADGVIQVPADKPVWVTELTR